MYRWTDGSPAVRFLCAAMISFRLIGGGIVDASQGVQAAGIADKGQALGNDLDQEIASDINSL